MNLLIGYAQINWRRKKGPRDASRGKTTQESGKHKSTTLDLIGHGHHDQALISEQAGAGREGNRRVVDMLDDMKEGDDVEPLCKWDILEDPMSHVEVVESLRRFARRARHLGSSHAIDQ